MRLALSSPAPSEIAGSAAKFKEAQDKHPIYMGRPLNTRTGPPISIYVPAFAHLRDRLASLEGRGVRCAAQDDTLEPGPSTLKTVARLFMRSCEFYATEADREDVILPLVETLLEIKLSRHQNMSPGEKKAEFDAVGSIPLDATAEAYALVVEVKNELGLAGASGVQCAFIYEKAVALPSVCTFYHACYRGELNKPLV